MLNYQVIISIKVGFFCATTESHSVATGLKPLSTLQFTFLPDETYHVQSNECPVNNGWTLWAKALANLNKWTYHRIACCNLLSHT